tara:strand:- start:853 stop:1737 length:885 start_codon:yes stop_codon:yes gene_type:complete
MKILFILILLLPVLAHSFEFIRSATFSLDTISSDSDLRTSAEEILLVFKPNVSTGFGFAVETEYVSLGYVFSGADPQNKNLQESRFRDIKLDFSIHDFDIRLNYQSYKGAAVENAGVNNFYQDYRVEAYNFRAHYYFNESILGFVRDGKILTNSAATNKGYTSFSSWFAGLNLDQRAIALPSSLIAAHQSRLDDKGVIYKNGFDVFSYGPLVGYDYFMFYNQFFLRGKFAAGKSFQGSGKSANQYEVALSIGLGIKEDHAFSINLDAYIMSFKEGNQLIQNQNNQATLEYNIAF